MRKKRTKADVKAKHPFSWGVKTRKGKEQKSGTIVEFINGETATLLTPSGKATKYAGELAMGVKVTNNGEFKVDNNGNEIALGCCERAYRAGYLDCQKDNAKAYNAKKKKAGKQ
ncbi:MAG: hypothetical protein K2K60_01465 [Clostridia bacterium]|nr:hypothetical protein [Clostridia bacterium]